MSRTLFAALFIAVMTNRPCVADEPEATPQQVFERRILPIFKSPQPSSCLQCHLAGVNLKNYILPSHEKTFASLRDQGLIDLDKPERSRILQLIRMGDDNSSAGARVHQKTRAAEYEAFADWVRRSAADPKLRALPKLDANEAAKPAAPNAVIRHARTDRLLEAFANSVWALRFRCMSCHTEGSEQNRKLVAEHGERVAWFKRAGPEATLDALRKGHLIDVDDPEKSLLLLKPLNRVKHGGGVKFAEGDQGYKAFRGFIEDYARTVKGGYRDAASLPRADGPLQFGTERWFKLVNTPEAWGERLLQVEVYAWDPATKAWETEPVATSDRLVAGKARLWQHTLTLLAARDSARAKAWKARTPALPAGRYLVKVRVDTEGRLSKDWKATLGESDFVGQAEMTAPWPEGYGKMTVLDAGKLAK
jgi:hypothetical protein